MNPIVRVAVPRPLWTLFDYFLPEGSPVPQPGARVRVPFGSTELVGLAIETSDQIVDGSDLKTIVAVIDDVPVLQTDVLELIQWAAAYYHHPPGDALFSAIPVALRDGRHVQPVDQRFWQLLTHPTEARLPARAARQIGALEALVQAGGITSHESLVGAGFDTRVLNELVKKGLIGPAPPPAPTAHDTVVGTSNFELTDEQRSVTKAARDALGRFECLLLDGVTGSGKTEIYLQVIESVLASGGQALVLIPEIALTPQTLERFTHRFGGAAVYHSGLTESERAQTWLQCRTGRARVLIGTRSAIFVPFSKLGLIVVDEEHDGSFKQQDGFRYSARDLAIKRAQLLDIPLLMGTATPALETLHNARRGRYRHLRLTARPGAAKATSIKLVDIRGLTLDDGLSAPLSSAIAAHLAQGNQTLLFINRRGYSPSYLCTRCGWCAGCPRCESKLTLHQIPAGLRCHHCGFASALPPRCPECGHPALRPVGIGTQRSEQGIARAFPNVPVIRIDRDTTRSARTMASHIEMIGRGEPAVLIGTQMLAKGHHFPRVTLVGVINADAGFASPDFRAPEHTAQLIIQVAGRAGRAERPGEVWIQTYNPDNPLLQALVEHGYEGFAVAELAHRAAAGLPPMRALALLKADGVDMERTLACLHTLAQTLLDRVGVEVLGPTQAPLARRARRYRCQTALLAGDRATLGRALDALIAAHGQSRFAGVRWSIDVDPYDMS
jgi:primosomal protein N' (replication factor Y)